MDPEVISKLKEEMTQYLMISGSPEGDGGGDEISLSDITLESFPSEESLNKYLEIFESELTSCTDLCKNGSGSGDVRVAFIGNELRRRRETRYEDKAVQVDIDGEYAQMFFEDPNLGLSELQSWTIGTADGTGTTVHIKNDRVPFQTSSKCTSGK